MRSINYSAIRSLSPNGSKVQSDDGQVWEMFSGKQTKLISAYVSWNGIISHTRSIDGKLLNHSDVEFLLNNASIK